MNSNDTRPLGYWITAVDRLMRAEFATVFEDEGITRRDWRMLNRIAGTHGERPTHDRHGHRLRRLIGLGWIERTADDWALTESGTLAMQRLSSSVEEIRARVADVLTAEEYAAMTASLEKVARGFGWEDGKPLPRRHGRAGRGPGRERRGFGHGHGHGRFGHGHSGHGHSGHGHSGHEHGRSGHGHSGHGHSGHGHEHGRFGHRDSGHGHSGHGHAHGRFGRERGFGHAHGHEGENSQGHPHHRGHSGHGHSGHGDSGHAHGQGHGRHGFGPRHMSEGRFARVQHVHFHTHC